MSTTRPAHDDLKMYQSLVIAVFLSLFSAATYAVELPELPRDYVDTTYNPPAGSEIVVKDEGDFQEALDSAEPGDVIILEAGATYSGPFILPVKPGSEWIVIRSSASEDSLPPPGSRIDPSYSNLMPKLISTTEPVISSAPGAHHFRFIGVEIRPARSNEAELSWQWSKSLLSKIIRDKEPDGIFLHNLVILGVDETRTDQLPHHIIFDRCYIHGDPVQGTRRGIAMNSRHTAVIDSYLSDFKIMGADAQAIAGWNGSGPFKIVNNYLEGAGENVLFGGADPSIRELVPSDIEIRHNHFTKPLTWMIGHADFVGTPWSVKNLFELKNARRVLIDGNLFEYNWPHAQNGFAILFTVRNQDGNAPWSVVEDVTFTNNVLRHIGSGINILGYDDNYPSRQTRRILIKNNLFSDVGGSWGQGRLFQLVDGTEDIIIENNTAMQTENIVFGDGRAHSGFVFSGNIIMHNDYGVIGTDAGIGTPSLEKYFPEVVFRNNIIIGGAADQYPSENYFPSSLKEAGLRGDPGAGYRHMGSSLYKESEFGEVHAGVDFNLLCSAINIPGNCH